MTGRCARAHTHTHTHTNKHTSNERIISAIHFVHLAEIKIDNCRQTATTHVDKLNSKNQLRPAGHKHNERNNTQSLAPALGRYV